MKKLLAVVVLAVCVGCLPMAGGQFPAPMATPSATLLPAFIATPQAAQAAAQATRIAGESQMLQLQVQGTIVAMQMTAAAATEQHLASQTQQALAATVTAERRTIEAQSTATAQAATATRVAYEQAATATQEAANTHGTATAQTQATLEAQSTAAAAFAQTATAYPITQTPLAATQAVLIASAQRDQQRAYWQQAVTPFQTILPPLAGLSCLVLIIIGAVLAYTRLMPVLELRLRTIPRGGNDAPLILLQNMLIDPDRSFGPALLLSATGATSTGHAPTAELQAGVTWRDQAIDLVRGLPHSPTGRAGAQKFAGHLMPTGDQARAALPAPLPQAAPWKLLEGWQGQTFPLGVSQSGPVLVDPLRTPHLLIAATSGAGKTMCGLRPLAAAALARGQRVILLNDAGGDFAPLMTHPNLVIAEEDPTAIADVLEGVAAEVNSRSAILRAAGVSTWSRLGAEQQGDRAAIMVVVDELVALTVQAAPDVRRRIWAATIAITSKGRKMGISFVAATTDPTYRTLGREGLIVRDNCGRVAFKMRDASTSQAMLDKGGAESLGENQFLALLAGEMVRGVAFHPEDDDLRDYLERNPVEELPAWVSSPREAAPNVDPEIAEIAETIRPAWEGGERNQSELARLCGQANAGAFHNKLKQAMALLRSTTTTEEP